MAHHRNIAIVIRCKIPKILDQSLGHEIGCLKRNWHTDRRRPIFFFSPVPSSVAASEFLPLYFLMSFPNAVYLHVAGSKTTWAWYLNKDTKIETYTR